jgi:pilus assembly protein FimV
MSGPSKLSLAIALALIGGNAFALGLGSIQVKSGLNQPLNAEIAVTAESPAEAAGLIVGLASAEDFTRVGLNRTRVSVPIDFAVSTNARGQSVIKLTTKDIVREPFLDLLVEVNWPKGKLLREYTVLLDPPVVAPARGSSATVAPAKEVAPASAQKLAEPKQPKPKATTVKPPRAVAAEPKPAPAPKSPPPAPSAAPKHVAAAGDYGPVAEGETLSEVARATKPDDSTNVNQMMLALLKNNPNAFYKDNINALKRGAILRIPSSDEIKATGTSMAVAAAVRDQNASWSGNAAVAKPTVVANAGAPKSAPPAKPEKNPAAKPSEHLALVPPRAGKDSQTTGDRPGPSTGTGTSAETKAELTRTKEALASREQEAGELRSRVKQLEDLNGKDQRLLSLKESEIADLQNKLKQLQAGKPAVATTTTPATTPPPATVAATKPAETPATTATKPTDTAPKPADAGTKTEPKLTAQDIWGDISASGKNPAKTGTPTTPAATTPATTPTTTTTTPPTTPPASTTPAASSSTAPSTASSTAVTPPPSTTPASTTAPVTPSTTTTTPITTPTTSAPVSITATPPPTTPVKPTTPAATPKPITTPPLEQPWYQNNTALLAGGAGLLLIGLLALMRFMRKPKPVLMPVGPDEADVHSMSGDDEHHLLDALAQHPGDPHLSLELLSLYYAQHNAAKFEAAAEAMYAHIADPTQPEWQQVRVMGEQLCPNNPLFGGSEDFTGAVTHGRDDHAGFGHLADSPAHDDSFDLGRGAHAANLPPEDNFDFDLTDHAAAGTVIPAHEMDFSQQTIVGHPTPPPPPTPAFQAPPARVAPAPVPAPVAAKPAEDFFAGEDAIGTKLDLAKAYLDMGDPEGARSMLDEVMAEGNDAQKGEARKLLAEIR